MTSKLWIDPRLFREKSEKLGVIVSKNSFVRLESLFEEVYWSIYQSEENYKDGLEKIVPDGAKWFREDGENDYFVMHHGETRLLNGLSGMMEWLLKVVKCWIEAKGIKYLCSSDLNTIIRKSNLFRNIEKIEERKRISSNSGIRVTTCIDEPYWIKIKSIDAVLIQSTSVETFEAEKAEAERNSIGDLREEISKLVGRLSAVI